MVNKITTPPTTSELIGKVNEIIDDKQDTLVSGTNIKTINNTSILGSGNISVGVSNPLRIEKTVGTDTYFYEVGINNNNRIYTQCGVDRDGLDTLIPLPTSYSFSGTDIDISYGSSSGEQEYIQTVRLSIGSNIARKSDIPTKTSDLTNDSGYITNVALNGYATENWVGQQGYITGITSSDVTTALGYTPYNSSNPNGYITNSALTPYVLSSSLATVATSGSYNDLTNKPDLTTKADVDLSNINTSGKSFTSGLGMPSDRYINLTLGVSGSSYIAPANGYFALAGTSNSGSSNYAHVQLQYTNIVTRSACTAPSARVAVYIPVKKGDTVQVGYQNVTDTNFIFKYAEGSKSEAS